MSTFQLSAAATEIVREWNKTERSIRERIAEAKTESAIEALDAEFEEQHSKMWEALQEATGLSLDDEFCWSLDDSFLEKTGLCYLRRCNCPEEMETPDDEPKPCLEDDDEAMVSAERLAADHDVWVRDVAPFRVLH
jgi:hypothetical protein